MSWGRLVAAPSSLRRNGNVRLAVGVNRMETCAISGNILPLAARTYPFARLKAMDDMPGCRSVKFMRAQWSPFWGRGGTTNSRMRCAGGLYARLSPLFLFTSVAKSARSVRKRGVCFEICHERAKIFLFNQKMMRLLRLFDSTLTKPSTLSDENLTEPSTPVVRF